MYKRSFKSSLISPSSIITGLENVAVKYCLFAVTLAVAVAIGVLKFKLEYIDISTLVGAAIPSQKAISILSNLSFAPLIF